MRKNMLVRKFDPKDAEQLSQLIIQNLQQVNIEDILLPLACGLVACSDYSESVRGVTPFRVSISRDHRPVLRLRTGFLSGGNHLWLDGVA
jgi:hypothetical protein